MTDAFGGMAAEAVPVVLPPAVVQPGSVGILQKGSGGQV